MLTAETILARIVQSMPLQSELLGQGFALTPRSTPALEILDRPLMILRGLARRKSPKVAALAGLGIFLARIQTVLSGYQLSDHL